MKVVIEASSWFDYWCMISVHHFMTATLHKRIWQHTFQYQAGIHALFWYSKWSQEVLLLCKYKYSMFTQTVCLMVWYLYIKWYFLSLSKHYTTTASFTDVLLALFPGLPQLQTFFPSYCKWSKLGTRLYSFTFDLNWPCYTSSALNLCAIHAALRFHFCVTLSKNADYANLCLFFSLLCTGIKVLSFSYKNIPIGLLWSAVQLALKNEEQFPPSFSTSACKCFVQSTISRFVEMISRLFCKLEIMQCMCNIACDWLMLYDGHTDSMCTASEKGW